MALAGGYANNHHGASSNLKIHTFSHVEMDTCDQDKPANFGYSRWDRSDIGRPQIMVLPGAWAMGDGLILDEEMHTGQLSTSSSAASSMSSSPWNVESFSSHVVRLAGSFRTSVGGYIADLTTAFTSDQQMEEQAVMEHTTFVEGDIVWMPRAHTHIVSAEKKGK